MTDYLPLLTAALVLFCGAGALAQSGLDKIVPPGAEVEQVATGFTFTEGPAWDGKGNVYFSDIPENVIKRVDEKGNVSVFMQPSQKSNGLMFDADGTLIACRHWARDVARISPDGKVTVLADSYNGKQLNSPNDCIIAADGAIYFTDPHYGLERRPKEQDVEGVYRLDTAGKVTRVIDDMTRPNGLFISPDGKTLYVADTQERKLRAYTLQPDGSATGGRDFATMTGGPDGMTLDREGNIYCTDGGGVWVFDPTGKHLGTIETPETPANCTFGGKDNKTLYMTARKSVYRIRLLIPGLR
ncbi:MAG: SMP-30/gluconolactonase/LRE family protein [Armatimonadota bacterium]